MDDEQGIVQSECKHRGSSLDIAFACNTLSFYRLAWQFSAEFARIMMALGQTVKHAQKMLGIFRAAMLGAQALASKGEGHDGVAAGTCHVEYGS